jgi:hypothetical protein
MRKKVIVNLYCYDNGVDMILGQDFVNIYLPFTVNSNEKDLHVNGKKVFFGHKKTFENKVPTNVPDEVEHFVEKL